MVPWEFEGSIGDGLWGVGPLDRDGWAAGVGLAGRWERLIPPAAVPNGNAAGGLWLQC